MGWRGRPSSPRSANDERCWSNAGCCRTRPWLGGCRGQQQRFGALLAELLEHGSRVNWASRQLVGDLPPFDVLMLDVSPRGQCRFWKTNYRGALRAPTALSSTAKRSKSTLQSKMGFLGRRAMHARQGRCMSENIEEVAAGASCAPRTCQTGHSFLLGSSILPTEPIGWGRSPFVDLRPRSAWLHRDATQAIVSQIERFAPGFRDRIKGIAVRSTTEMSRYNENYVGGDIIGGASTPKQLIFRPRVAFDPYSAGIKGVWLCSASTPPGAGAHGMCGSNAAERALRYLSRR